MANEQELIDRWGNIFKGTQEYETALKQAAIRKATQRQQAQEAIRRAPSARVGAALQMDQLRRDREPDPMVQGLDDFQQQRVTDYMDQARQRQSAASLAGPVSVGYSRQGAEPDFKLHTPYANLTQRGGMGMTKGEVAKVQAANLDYEMAGPRGANSPERMAELAKQRKNIAQNYGVNFPDQYGLDVPGDAERNYFAEQEQLAKDRAAEDKRLKEEATRKERDTAAREQENNLRFTAAHVRTIKQLESLPDGQRIAAGYEALPLAEQQFLNRMPWDKRIEAIKSHPLITGIRKSTAPDTENFGVFEGVLMRKPKNPFAESDYRDFMPEPWKTSAAVVQPTPFRPYFGEEAQTPLVGNSTRVGRRGMSMDY